MWLSALFTSSAANFGRLLVVGLLPNAILVAYLWLLIAMGAFTNTGEPMTPRAVADASFRTDAGGLLFFVLLVVTLTAVLQPFQIRMVRMLEGYWQGRLGAPLHRLGVAMHSRRQARLRRRANESEELPTDEELCQTAAGEQIRVQRRARRADVLADRAMSKLILYPPDGEPVMPTMLGNVLRRNERVAGERYALNTVSSWPRLYPFLGQRLSAEYDSETDSVDASTNLAVTFVLMSVFGFFAFANDTWMLLVPLALLLLAVASYRAAIAAAGNQGVAMAVAYDLHRFDLIRGLHLELPTTPENEQRRNAILSRFLRKSSEVPDPPSAAEALQQFTYVHPKGD
jgi:hypothetical protein